MKWEVICPNKLFPFLFEEMSNMTKDKPFSVYKIDSDTKFQEVFSSLLINEDIAQKAPNESQIFGYLTRYLKKEDNGIGVQTIVCENDYSCLNFLEDYANYYSRTYTNYDKKCKRIHFFSTEIQDDDEFSEMIINKNAPKWNGYSGCIVVKPIPKGIFGVTYLNTYDYYLTEDGRGKHKERYYKCLTNHKVNLFGNEINILTMPFKEQDGAVASCATTALWMAFHKTSELFNTNTPSLSEITILAGAGDETGRIFPSKGLNIGQICNAIIKLGMIPELRDEFPHVSFFKSKLHAYLKGDIPILLGMTELPGAKDSYNHLVTMNGYRYKTNKYFFREGTEKSRLLSDTIEMFYVNDDQVGPFARTKINGKEGNEIEITTSWGVKVGKSYSSTNLIKVKPAFTIIPLTPSIKVSFEDTYVYYIAIKGLIEYFELVQPNDLLINYDIFITRSNEYKKRLLNECNKIIDSWTGTRKEIIKKDITNILTSSLPKYIWVIEGRDSTGTLIFDFLYDTVETRQNGLPASINIYSEKFLDLKNQVVKEFGDEVENSFTCEYKNFKNSLLSILTQHAIKNSKTKNRGANKLAKETKKDFPKEKGTKGEKDEFVKEVAKERDSQHRKNRKPKLKEEA